MSDSIELTLPDGAALQAVAGAPALDAVAGIGPGLAKAALAVEIDGKVQDLMTPLTRGGDFRVFTDRDEASLDVLRHSAAHVMAQAIMELWPDTKLAYGPPVEDGFYYDMELEHRLGPDDFAAIEQRMQAIIDADLPFTRVVVSRDEARRILGDHEYKLDNLDKIPEGEEISFYVTGEDGEGAWRDLCGGPHVPSTGRIKAFKVMKVAGAFWRGDPRLQQLQRVYGTAWFHARHLEKHLNRLEEAEKRDHRRIGRQLELFSTSGDRTEYHDVNGDQVREDIGPGLILWHPMGGRVRTVIEEHWRHEHYAAGYEIVYSPHLARSDIWKISGHTGFYKDSMFSGMDIDGQEYLVKPMNCPYHIQIYKARPRSYREFPLRWAELGTVYRYELSGVLEGLKRVRGFTQDDAHLFCREDQIADEVRDVLDFSIRMLAQYGFEDLAIYLSTRPEKSVGSDAHWELATRTLREQLDAAGVQWKTDPGEGVFYGPKIDIKIKDVLGRQWQCSTIQVDFNLPERFDISYVGSDNQEHRPIMLHRTLLGSMERFMGVLIEHFAGAFPVWLAPVQAIVLPVTDRTLEYGAEVAAELKAAGFRAELDDRSEKLGFKIREAQLRKIPYMLVVGDREAEDGAVAPRTRKGQDLGAMPRAQFIERLRGTARPGVDEL